jgi:hypothetical protein
MSKRSHSMLRPSNSGQYLVSCAYLGPHVSSVSFLKLAWHKTWPWRRSMAGKSARFDLTEEEESTLKMWVDSHRTEQRYSRRAQVILLSAKGLTLKKIVAGSGLGKTNRLKWRKQFLQERLDSLRGSPRKGRPPGDHYALAESLRSFGWRARGATGEPALKD